jgi:glycosyltransferase involved in cell wall biosynthesis
MSALSADKLSEGTIASYLSVDRFESATIVLPVMNETASLEETVKVVLRDVEDRTRELLIVVCDRTTAEAMATVDRLSKSLGGMVRVHCQKLPFLGGAMREAFDLARGSHVVMMASDLETDPHAVRTLIAAAQMRPSAIVTASRWRATRGFQGYSKVKLLCNWVFQRFFSTLYGVRLSDMTFAYRIFPTKLVQSIRWEELRHAFLFETLVKPLRLGIEVIEIPSGWKARTEGKSQNTFLLNFVYFRTGLKTRFASRQSILKPGLQARNDRAGKHE